MIIFHSIGSQVKSIAYSCTASFRDKMSPIKNLVLNQLGMKICLQVCRDGHFLSPPMKLNGDIAFFQIVLHMDHIGPNSHAHQACSGHD